ncbi:DUF3261 domain-containing protein [Oxalobacteraceae bacterium CAVE-383]|nr:DUF3261 domain-containing protein [Oxalobacteraceae bacterium CAVE-383]
MQAGVNRKFPLPARRPAARPLLPTLRGRLALITLPALLALSACAGMAPAGKPAAPARLGLKLAPATLGQSLSLQQHLIVEREGRTDELDTALEIDADANQLTLVGLAFGQRVMTLQYDGKELKTWRHFMLPPQVRGEDVLEDLQLTLWPAAALRAALPPGWDIQDAAEGAGTAQRRTLSLEGRPITVIDYPGARRWGGKVVLNNLRYHYRLTIVSAADGA